MHKVLKLTGVKAYSTPAFGGVVLQQNQIIMADGALADMLMAEKKDSDNDGIGIPFFTEVEADKAHYDFRGKEMPVNGNSPIPVIAVPTHHTGTEGDDSSTGTVGETSKPAAKTVKRTPQRAA